MKKNLDVLEEFAYINRLISRYGELLTEAQLQTMNYYYQFDLSLSEISENLQVSRTAVADCIKKSTAKLKYYEEKLGLIENYDKVMLIMKKISLNPQDMKLIEELERTIKNGI